MVHARYGIAASLVFVLVASLSWMYLNQMPGWRAPGLMRPKPQVATPAQPGDLLVADQKGPVPVSAPPPPPPVAKTTTAPASLGRLPLQGAATTAPAEEVAALGRSSGDSDLRPPSEPIGRDQFAGAPDNPFRQVSEAPVSTFSIDVDTASYSFMRASLDRNLLPQPAAAPASRPGGRAQWPSPVLPASRRRT